MKPDDLVRELLNRHDEGLVLSEDPVLRAQTLARLGRFFVVDAMQGWRLLVQTGEVEVVSDEELAGTGRKRWALKVCERA